MIFPYELYHFWVPPFMVKTACLVNFSPGSEIRGLDDPVLITLQASAASGPLETWTCVFWNETEKQWSTEGEVSLVGGLVAINFIFPLILGIS